MKRENAPLLLVGIAGLVGGGYVLWRYVWPHEEPCTEDATKCIGLNLFTCEDGTWVLTEKNSPECEEPPPPTGMQNLLASYW